jgi:hypothetical protein
MPSQVTLDPTILIPADGCIVSYSTDSGSSYTNIGTIMGDVAFTPEAETVEIQTGNAGLTPLEWKNPKLGFSFELMEFNMDIINDMTCGIGTKTTTAAAPNASIPDQVISATWADNTVYNLVMYESSSSTVKLNMGSTEPTLTSVTIDAGGVNEEVLDAGSDYFLVKKTSSPSGWGIVFEESSISGSATYTDAITIDYGSNTPIASTTIQIGSSVKQLTPLMFKIYHVDANSLTRALYIYECYLNPDSMAWMFKGEDKSEKTTLPFNFTGQIDTSRADGDQLYSVYWETGAL